MLLILDLIKYLITQSNLGGLSFKNDFSLLLHLISIELRKYVVYSFSVACSNSGSQKMWQNINLGFIILYI